MDDSKIDVDDFSSGLWRMKVHLEPYSGDEAEMSVEDAEPFLEATGGEEPLLIRVNRTFIPVYVGGSIPYKYITIPEDMEEELNLDLPSEKYIYVVKDQNRLKKVLLNEKFDDVI